MHVFCLTGTKNGLYGNLGPEKVWSEEHQNLALEAARNGIVLLKNSANLLPLTKTKSTPFAVIGPNSDTTDTLLGNYEGVWIKVKKGSKKQDRVELGLPGKQEDLVSAVAKAAKNPVLLVLLYGSPVDVSFAKADAKNGLVILVKLVDSLLQKLYLVIVIHVSFTLTFKFKLIRNPKAV
ncbi:probable beta-D-xylosidase 7 [Tanacetum coccineum]